MKKLILLLGLTVFLTSVACDSLTDSEKTATSEDEQEINLILEEEDLVYEEVDDGDESTFGVDDPNWDNDSFAKATSDDADDSWKRARFGRKVQARRKNVEIVFTTDTTAQAVVYTKFTGQFVSFTSELSGDSLIWERFTKPMEHSVDRIINFVKYTDGRRDTSRVDPRRRFRWRVISTSMGDGMSEPSTVSIVEITIKPEGQDEIVITNPLEYIISRQSALRLPFLSTVKIQVKVENKTENPIEHPVGSGSYENLRLHYGRNRLGHHAKKPFEYVGTDDSGYHIYEGTWTVRQQQGTHHAVIDMIDNGTIFSSDNDAYPYNSATWGMPYIVVR